jgi:hypothetical protein
MCLIWPLHGTPTIGPMRQAAASQGPTDEDAPVARRRLVKRLPIWVRVSVITGVVLAVVLLSTMLIAAGGGGDGDSGGNHGSRGGIEMNSDDSGGDHGSGGDHDSGGSRSSGGDHAPGADHDPGSETD